MGGIKSDNLNEIRSLKMPPEAIRDVLEGVLRIMGNYDTSWISMKRFLGNKSVKDELIHFDSRKITPEVRVRVRVGIRVRIRVRTRVKVRLRVTNLPNPKPGPNPNLTLTRSATR